jgi:uncharacterized protein (TIGR02145 family)
MKINCAKYFIILAWILLSILSGCKKQDALPTVTTNEVTDFGLDYAVLGGEVISNGGSYVTAEGVCWSTQENPTLSFLNYYSRGTGKGGFSFRVVPLYPGTIYFIRAYATNNAGTAYGNQVTLKTLGDHSPLVNTEIVTGVSATSAISRSNINSDGMAERARGVCWSTSHNPTISNNITIDGAGVGSFTSNITGLIPNTPYYLRAYATNSVGISYGNEISFATEQPSGPTVTDIDGNVYHTVTIGSQVWMVENLRTTHFRNGDPILTSTEDSGMPGPNTYKCYWDYNRDANNSAIYGRLYGRDAASDKRNIAPEGWHVPSVVEWTTLFDYLTNNGYGYKGSGNGIAKSMAAKSGWRQSSDEGDAGNDQPGNNSSGFKALSVGCYSAWYNSRGQHVGWWRGFVGLGYEGLWWGIDSVSSFRGGVHYDSSTIYKPNYDLDNFPVGISIRCVKD